MVCNDGAPSHAVRSRRRVLQTQVRIRGRTVAQVQCQSLDALVAKVAREAGVSPADVVIWLQDATLSTSSSQSRALQTQPIPVTAVVLQVPVDSHGAAQELLRNIEPALQNQTLLAPLVATGVPGLAPAQVEWAGTDDPSVTFSNANPYVGTGGDGLNTGGDGGDGEDEDEDEDPSLAGGALGIVVVGALVFLAALGAGWCLCRRGQGKAAQRAGDDKDDKA